MDLGRTPLLLLFLMVPVVLADDDWISKCSVCKCMWSDGKKKADCDDKNLSDIPSNLSEEIRYLNLASNPLYALIANVFVNNHLQYIQMLKLTNCSIEIVDRLAFAKLDNLIKLDLSRNRITRLDEAVFSENKKLRLLFLNYNNLTELRGSLFHNMTHLQRVEAKGNRIRYIDINVFDTEPSLQHIDLSDNNLKFVDVQLFTKLQRINSLVIQGNPWTCDCKLKKFRDFAMQQLLVTEAQHTSCAEPSRLKGRVWNDLQSQEFACTPKILEPTLERRFEVDATTNYTITCKVQGDPIPDVDWVTNGRIIDKDPRQNQQKYSTSKSAYENLIWSNLTIYSVTYRDRGEYKCIAKNPAGMDERNITVVVVGEYRGGGGFGSSPTFNILPWIIALIIGAIILLIIIAVLLCVCCNRTPRQSRPHKGGDLNQSSDYISLNGRPEIEKALITEVNPVVKPPRQYSVPPSVTSGATEVSDIKRTLLDGDSQFGDDDSRSFDFEAKLTPKIRENNHLDVDYRGDNQLPPDLLAFPARGVQVSPAGSTASTVADHSRLPVHPGGPHSPLHSPIYDTGSLYRTLPYSRSQSPFTSPLGLPVIAPRQGGYVTIPRRPRASWSAEPVVVTPLVGDPVYDNMGLRTTASGSSVLSLNKVGEATTPRSAVARPLPPTPGYVPVPCDPIAEHDPVPLTASTLPRNLAAHRAANQLSTPPAWLRNASDAASMRSAEPDSRRESTASLLPATPDGKVTKIPPRPPPKPKKRTSTGPLFEDEGEDGTEV